MPERLQGNCPGFSGSGPADTATGQRSGRAARTVADTRSLSVSCSAALRRRSAAVGLAHGASSPTAWRSPISRRCSGAAGSVRAWAERAIDRAACLRPTISRRRPWRSRTVLVFHTGEQYEIWLRKKEKRCPIRSTWLWVRAGRETYFLP